VGVDLHDPGGGRRRRDLLGGERAAVLTCERRVGSEVSGSGSNRAQASISAWPVTAIRGGA
jgi:hypothetical protein